MSMAIYQAGNKHDASRGMHYEMIATLFCGMQVLEYLHGTGPELRNI